MVNNAGIYRITNIIDGRIYIGSSHDIKDRWYGHKRKLNKSCHENKYLQEAWIIHKEDNFIFEIVESVLSLGNILEMEQRWIDETNCLNRKFGYNIKPNASNGRKKNINIEKSRDTEEVIGSMNSFIPNYKPLEIALIKRNKTRQNLKEDLNISGATLAKIKKRDFVSLQTISLLCEYLEVEIQDVVVFGEEIV